MLDHGEWRGAGGGGGGGGGGVNINFSNMPSIVSLPPYAFMNSLSLIKQLQKVLQ